jgi:hypothetical protein
MAAAAPPRKLEAGDEIAKLTTAKYDTCSIFLRGIVRQHHKAARRSFRAFKQEKFYERYKDELLDVARAAWTGDGEIEAWEVRSLFTNEAVAENPVTEALAATLAAKCIPNDELWEGGVDEELQKYALDDPNCPDEVKELAIQRPSVFDIMVSWKRWGKVADQMSAFRATLRAAERGDTKPVEQIIVEMTPHIAKLGRSDEDEFKPSRMAGGF